MEGIDRVVFLGPPGSGKGTQAEILARRLSVPAISTGDLLRGAVEEGSPLGRRVAEIMARGALVDDGTMADVVRERLRRPDAAAGFILDGYPRTVTQAETLDGIVRDEQGGELAAVVLFEVPEQELVRRALARQRADDREEVIRRRLAVYRQQTAPLVHHFRQRGLLRQVNGDRAIGEVAVALERALCGEALSENG